MSTAQFPQESRHIDNDGFIDYACYLLRKIGIRPNEQDRKIFEGCISVSQMMDRLCESESMRRLINLHDEGEFYVSLLCECKWEPRTGFDAYGAFEYLEMIKAGKLEVKTGEYTDNRMWNVRFTGTTGDIRSDVLVFIGMRDSIYMTKATMLAIPKEVLIPIASNYKCEYDARVHSGISKNRINIQTGELNQWYQYEVPNHNLLKDYVTRYIHGDFSVGSGQLSLW